MIRRPLSGLFFLISMQLAACGGRPQTDSNSRLEYGNFSDQAAMGSLAKLKPDSLIKPCGPFAKFMVSGIKRWATAIGRIDFLRIEQGQECTGEKGEVTSERAKSKEHLATCNAGAA